MEAGIAGAPADDIVLAVSEACANAVLHSRSEVFQVMWRCWGDRAEARIRDQGRFRLTSPSTPEIGLGGNGIPLMTALMDEVSVRRGTVRRPGTDVRLVKWLEASRGWTRRLRRGPSAMARRLTSNGGNGH